MTPLLTVVEEAIKAKLAPMVGTGAGNLKQIDVHAFGSQEQFAELLQRFRPRMPGAILAPPSITYTQPPARIIDAVLGYSLLIGYATRETIDTRRAFHFARHDEVMQHLANQSIPRTGIATTAQLDFIRMGTWRMGDEEEFAVQMFTFNITVRNWQINLPA